LFPLADGALFVHRKSGFNAGMLILGLGMYGLRLEFVALAVA